MSARERLPARRLTERFELRHGNQVYTVGVGYYADGRPGEVFLSCGKSGSDVDTAVKDSAIALSLALQHGCKLDAVAKSFLHDAAGRPEGVLGAVAKRLAERRAEAADG
jgi:hypothetical protein